MANVSFPHRLVLNRFFLKLLGSDVYNLDLDPFRDATKSFIEESLELHEEDGTSRYYQELIRIIPSDSIFSPEMLLDFDENIKRHTNEINEKRSSKIRWKYFQYLSLLFTEIYLDWYFRDADDLLNELNNHLISSIIASVIGVKRKKIY
jgi:hypothetical protein